MQACAHHQQRLTPRSPWTDVYISRDLHKTGTWDEHVMTAVKTAIHSALAEAQEQPPVMLDVGANIGVFAVEAR